MNYCHGDTDAISCRRLLEIVLEARGSSSCSLLVRPIFIFFIDLAFMQMKYLELIRLGNGN